MDDLLYALMGPAIAVVADLLMREDLTGYPLTFGLVWFTLGIAVAAGRFGFAHRRSG